MNENREKAVTLKDFDFICRICLQFKENMIDIFGSGIYSQILEVTNLKMESNDKLPKTLCESCNSQMDHISKFLQQAKSSDKLLRTILLECESSKTNLQLQKNYPSEKPPRKNHKKRTKPKKDKTPKVEDDQMYLIVVPGDDESIENQVCIADLSSENDNTELSSYCRTLVQNHFSDHTYPKDFSSSGDYTETKTYPVNLNVFSCTVCGESFENCETLEYHLQVHGTTLESSDFSYTCPVCNFSEKDKSSFLCHLSSHRSEGLSFVKVNESGEKLPVDENERHVFTEEDSLCKVFLMNFLNFTCSSCCSVQCEDSISEHLKSSCGTEVEFTIRYTCPVCQEVMNNKDIFINHLSHHQSDNIFFMNVDGYKQPVESGDSVFLLQQEAMILVNVINETQKVFKVIEPFSCGKCDCEFETYGLLLNHCTSCHPGDEIILVSAVCPACLKEWNAGDANENRKELYEHLEQHKSEGTTFVRVKQNNTLGCVLEKYPTFSQSQLLLNFLNTSLSLVDFWSPELVVASSEDPSPKLTCDMCQKQFIKKNALIKHLKSHQKSIKKASNYICEKCGKKCAGKLGYKKHFSKHLKTSGKNTCVICNKAFANKSTLNGHVRLHFKDGTVNNVKTPLLICEKCGKIFPTNASLAKHMKQHSKNKENTAMKCEICDRDFFKLSTFERHKSAHLNPKYLECDICKLPLSSAVSLQKHSELHKNGSSTYDCQACKLSFLTKESLTTHQTRAGHIADRKPLECNVCHEKFYVGKKFMEHIKTHPKYKMGECTLCGKRLSTIQSLMVHMDRHFEYNKILCPHCGKQFFEEKNYHRHLLTHQGVKPYACDVEGCGKSFYTLFEIKRHTKYHNNTRDFRCSYCSKSFHEANHLTVHVRTHTGERPYTCPHCNKGFITRTRCKHHIKLVHQGIGYDLIRTNISKKVTVFEAIEAVV